MNDRIGGIPPSGEKPKEPLEPLQPKRSQNIEPEEKEEVLGMMMTKKQKKQFIDQLTKSIIDDFNTWAKRALTALKKLGKESRGEE